ncbi:hypothetical protein SK803_22800 [Lentzea sp. BCCO 10_0856]|uniref:Uncharacterized protein n=1 Tax=Lentzea miocenica TaxID=3095431 RepID=A0ABU4T4H7_9PSEU|nr:hypothetical protein [Lentzea sp. BCCO 10_0856]MDX8033056.1 hypothetical protein [Lentzea sp. BCCO 10_0856]
MAAVTWINPPWPAEQALHSSLTAVAIMALWLLRKRLVHFAYGVCLTAVLRQKWLRSLEIVLATSALYELPEWAIAIALAALGALVTSLASFARRRSPAATTR